MATYYTGNDVSITRRLRDNSNFIIINYARTSEHRTSLPLVPASSYARVLEKLSVLASRTFQTPYTTRVS